MNRQPLDPYRMVALIAGIVFFCIGIYLVMRGVSAEGSIDIQSAILSGKITAGSAGLFVLFFSFFIIILSMLIGHHKVIPSIFNQHDHDNMYRTPLNIIYTLILATIILVIAAALVPTDKKIIFILSGGGFGFLTLIALIWFIDIFKN